MRSKMDGEMRRRCSLLAVWFLLFVVTITTVHSYEIPAIPFRRFRLWQTLPTDLAQTALQVEYSEELWNLPGLHPLESLSYETILASLTEADANEVGYPPSAAVALLEQLGVVSADNTAITSSSSSSSWDCHVNHYGDFTWPELQELEVDEFLQDLGWTQAMWENDNDNDKASPESDDLFWNELSPQQQQAALSLCYTMELWDSVPLELWESLPEDDTNNNNTPSPSPAQEDIPTQVPSTTTTIPPREFPPYPEYRFTLWSKLSQAQGALQNAKFLQYDQSSWNLPGTNPLESNRWSKLNNNTRAVQGLGFSDVVWDCYMNHYEDYTWEDLQQVGRLDILFQELGWTQARWNAGLAPSTDSYYWKDLLANQKKAAQQLCYTAELWDELPMTGWPDMMNDLPPPPPPPPPIDDIRYVLWKNLDSGMVEYATLLGYMSETWNLPGQAAIEKHSYQGIVDGDAYATHNIGTPQNAQALQAMGYTHPQWDCHVNHYDDFTWQELARIGVQIHFQRLGWTQATWEASNSNNNNPFSEFTYWYDLPLIQRTAAEGICYRFESWDKLPLEKWPQIVNAQGGLSRNVGVDLLIFVCFAVGCFLLWVAYMQWNSRSTCRRKPNHTDASTNNDNEATPPKEGKDEKDEDQDKQEDDEEAVVQV